MSALREIGIFDAKARLSELLHDVEAGESLTLTRRGVPVARLVPVPKQAERASALRRLRELGSQAQAGGSADGQEEPVQADPRVRAVMALAPMGVAFSPSSLAAITVPVAIYAGEKDTFLVPRFHASWVMQNMNGAHTTLQLVPNAGHYAFMNTPTMNLPSPDGNVAADPAGFDRAAFLDRLAQGSVAFFDMNLRQP